MKEVVKNVSKYEFLRPPEESLLTQQALFAMNAFIFLTTSAYTKVSASIPGKFQRKFF